MIDQKTEDYFKLYRDTLLEKNTLKEKIERLSKEHTDACDALSDVNNKINIMKKNIDRVIETGQNITEIILKHNNSIDDEKEIEYPTQKIVYKKYRMTK